MMVLENILSYLELTIVVSRYVDDMSYNKLI